MTLQSNGAISFANINNELGVANTTTRTLNDSAARTLAGVASGQISLSNFYGKSNVTFSPSGGANSTSRQVLTDIQVYPSTATITITCNQTATWSYVLYYTSGAGTPTVSVANNGTGTSITFRMASASNFNRYRSWTVTGTASGISRYFDVQLSAEGNV